MKEFDDSDHITLENILCLQFKLAERSGEKKNMTGLSYMTGFSVRVEFHVFCYNRIYTGQAGCFVASSQM